MRPPRNSAGLTSRQCEALIAALDVRAVFLRRVLERLGWPHDDRLYVDAVNVLLALKAMRETLEALATFHGAFLDPPEDARPLNLPAEDNPGRPTSDRRPWEGGDKDTYWKSRQKRKG